MGRKYISQKKQTKEEMFDALVKNAIDFLDSALDDLDQRPKNSIVDFYTSIELFLKAKLMSEHWTLIISKPEIANINNFQLGDFHSIFLDDAVKRLKHILNEPLSDKAINNFKVLGAHRNQIVHFAHTDYPDFNATKAGIVVEQWSSWIYLYQLLTDQWVNVFQKYLPEVKRINKRMMEQVEFIEARYEELKPEIEIKIKSGEKIIDCGHCQMKSAIIENSHKWGDDYKCLVCGAKDTSTKTTNATIPCPKCGKEFEFFHEGLEECPNCEEVITTDTLIGQCEKKYIEGDAWWEEGGPCITECHICKNERPSVFYIDGLWSCVSCYDRGWAALSCDHCGKYITVGDMEEYKAIGCFKCRDENIKNLY
jgi:hypothetical protein